MDSTTSAYWDFVKKQCQKFSTENNKDKMVLDETLKDTYIELCRDAYLQCKSSVMVPDVTSLDRHKVAGILVVEGLKLHIVKRVDGKEADTA